MNFYCKRWIQIVLTVYTLTKWKWTRWRNWGREMSIQIPKVGSYCGLDGSWLVLNCLAISDQRHASWFFIYLFIGKDELASWFYLNTQMHSVKNHVLYTRKQTMFLSRDKHVKGPKNHFEGSTFLVGLIWLCFCFIVLFVVLGLFVTC